jgi:hypothetical protein
MSDDTMNHGDDAVVDDSTDDSLAAATGNGLRAGNYDAATIHQQNYTQMNELAQSLVEARRQETAQFEMRMVQSNNLFANQMSQVLANQAAAAAAASGLQTQQQSYTHSEATQDRVQTSADYLVSVGVTTPWLP